MTLGTALWSLQSLSGQDEGVKKALSDFFARDARLKNLFTIEQTAFGNYLTAMILVTTLKPDQTGADRETYAAMDKSASIYENLGSAKEAFAPMMNLKK
jgi:predicted amino acid-binding ACT domain protein